MEPALRRTTWHVDTPSSGNCSFESVDIPYETAVEQHHREFLQQAATNNEGLHLIATASRRVWEELYVGKKPVRVHEFEYKIYKSK